MLVNNNLAYSDELKHNQKLLCSFERVQNFIWRQSQNVLLPIRVLVRIDSPSHYCQKVYNFFIFEYEEHMNFIVLLIKLFPQLII